MLSFLRNLSRGRGTNEISTKVLEHLNIDVADLNPFGSAEGVDPYVLGIIHIIFCFGIVTAIIHLILFIVRLISSCCAKKSTKNGTNQYVKYVPAVLTVIIAIPTFVFILQLHNTAVPDFAKEIRLEITSITYDVKETTEQLDVLKSRFEAIADKQIGETPKFGEMVEEQIEKPLNEMLDESAKFSEMKIYPLLYLLALCIVILGIYYLPCVFSVFCGLLAVVQIVVFVVVLVVAVVVADVSEVDYRKIIRASDKMTKETGPGNEFQKLMNYYFNDGDFILDFDENIQETALAHLPVKDVVHDLVDMLPKSTGTNGKTADDVKEEDLKKLPEQLKDKIKNFPDPDTQTDLTPEEKADIKTLQEKLKNLESSQRRQLNSDADLDFTKVSKWYAGKLKENFHVLQEDVKKNFPESIAEFRSLSSKSEAQAIADAMNKNASLKNAYIYPYSILKPLRMSKRNYMDNRVKALLSQVRKYIVEPLGNIFVCLFCFWLLTACLMIALIADGCCSSGEKEEEKKEEEISV